MQVLILVLMEDALVHTTKTEEERKAAVLILVLMEDALVRYNVVADEEQAQSLNPCFNGRCTRTVREVCEYVAEKLS